MFIVFDGLDGSGKSTQATMLCRHLESLGMSYVLRAHPSGDNFFGRKSRAYLLLEGKRARVSASLFYLLDVVRSVLLYYWKRVDNVVFVRYLMGTAYLPESLFKLGYLFFLRVVPSSPHMFFIDTSPHEAHKRIEQNRSQKEMFESLEKLQKVHKKVTSLASRPEWTVIDGDRPSDEIQKEVKACLGL
jgi:dTMP kinase